MDDLYVLARFDDDDNFLEYIRKGRNHSISGYDDLASARRGLSQSRAKMPEAVKKSIRIVKAESIKEVE